MMKNRHLLPLIGYSLISLIVTWPLVTHLRGWVPGLGDWGQNLWALWWTRQALLVEGQQPFFTHYLFYPEGVTLLFHPLDVSDGLLALPLYGLLGGDVTYNLMILLSFVLAGYGAYLLALYLTHHRAAAFIAGLIFALSPYHFLRVDLGHLNLSTIQWIPFYALFLLKFVERGDKRAAALAVFFLVFTALNSWYYVVYCGLFSLAVIFWPGRKQLAVSRQQIAVSGQRSAVSGHHSSFIIHRSTSIIRIAVVLVASIILLLPLLLPMFRLLGSTTLIGAHNPLRHSADLLSFFVPGPPSTWAGWFEGIWVSYAAQNREPGASAYLGYSVLALSLVGLLDRRWRPQSWWWLAVALGFSVLALGPQLQIDGQILDISLPYHWLATLIPIFAITGIPGRFVVMTSLALAVLAAFGVAWLSEARRQPSAVSRQRLSFIIHYSLFIVIFIELLALPLHLTSTNVNPFYHTLAADQDTYAIIDIKWDANFLMHAQTIHHKPLIGGWLARLPQEQAAYLDESSLDKAFVRLLLGPEGAALTDPAAIRSAIQSALAEHEVRYIIDHNNAAGPWLQGVLGWSVVFEDDEVVVYGVEGS
ncbi:MAG: hypothetical protein KDJ97_02950 [Anaerolineae bacterium]|nr:hypothetical protein [Anaerolineae bacterium]